MNPSKNYVVTGGIACGKSTVMEFFKEKGFETYSADSMVHKLYEDEDVINSVEEIFKDEDIRNSDGSLNRKKLSKLIFNHEDLRRDLENLIHPLVIENIIKLSKEPGIKFFEIPLYSLVEESLLQAMDYDIISVDCNMETKLDRLINKRNMSIEQALGIIHVNDVWKDFKKQPIKVFINDKSPEELRGELSLFLAQQLSNTQS